MTKSTSCSACQVPLRKTADLTDHPHPAQALRIGNIVGTFIIRLIGAVLLEANDEWQLQHRYMQTEPMTELTPPLIEAIPTQISTAAA
jgi:hypothetical protein